MKEGGSGRQQLIIMVLLKEVCRKRTKENNIEVSIFSVGVKEEKEGRKERNNYHNIIKGSFVKEGGSGRHQLIITVLLVKKE